MPDATEHSTEPHIPEVVEHDPFREFALWNRQSWQPVYERLRDTYPQTTLDSFRAIDEAAWDDLPLGIRRQLFADALDPGGAE